MKTQLKFHFLSILLLGALFLTVGCGDDDPDTTTCTIQNWVGSYDYSEDCSGNTSPTTISIDSDGDLEVEIDNAPDFFILKDTELNGCKANAIATASLQFNLTLSGAGGNITGTVGSCNGTFTRK